MANKLVLSNKYDDCCRTCLKVKSKNMINIFEIEDSMNLLKVLLSCTTLNIQKEDSLPNKMCDYCYKCVIAFHKFKEIAEDIDIKLRNIAIVDQDVWLTNIFLQKETTIIKEPADIKLEVINHQKEEEFLGSTHKSENSLLTTSWETHERCMLMCEICNKEFKQSSKLEQHRKEHFKLQIEYVNEIKNESIVPEYEHEKVKNDQSLFCDICNIKFKSINSLSAHKRKHIERGRVLSCSICGKVFKKVSHLKRHELTHADNHPYKCMLCTKSFPLESKYLEHLNKHNGIKTHKCMLCQKTFTHLSTLKAHMNIHLRNKPYLCPTCGKTFDSSSNLNQHMKRHVGLKSFVCRLCPKQFVSKGKIFNEIWWV